MTLNRIGTLIAEFFYRDTALVRGEFTGAAGAVNTIKFKGLATITYVSAGLYRVKVFAADGSSALKNLHLKNLNVIPPTPTLTTDGGWTWSLKANLITSAGTFDIQTQAQGWAAADALGVIKVAFELSPEGPS